MFVYRHATLLTPDAMIDDGSLFIDGGYIRAAAGVAGIPLLTTASAALAAADGMTDWSSHELQVKPLQDFHRR